MACVCRFITTSTETRSRVFFQNSVIHISADINIADFSGCRRIHEVHEKVRCEWSFFMFYMDDILWFNYHTIDRAAIFLSNVK